MASKRKMCNSQHSKRTSEDRTMFKSTYRGFSGDAELLGTLNAAVLNTQKGVHLARLVMYENGTCMYGAPSGHGTCSSLSRWTMDGLHPPNWLLKVYIRLCLLKLKRDGTMTNTREKYKDYCCRYATCANHFRSLVGSLQHTTVKAHQSETVVGPDEMLRHENLSRKKK